MGLNNTPSGERIHIGIFGRRNAGKSSLINALTGQELAIVSPVEGTTTDPVQKAMELLPMGPVVLIDTPGMDDEGELGKLRVKKTYQMLNKSDLAVFVMNITNTFEKEDRELLKTIQKKKIPCVFVLNQVDRVKKNEKEEAVKKISDEILPFFEKEHFQIVTASAKTKEGIETLKETLAKLGMEKGNEKRLVADLLIPGKLTVLVIPIDKAAPKGRLILPQQQTIRDILEAGGACIVVRDVELEQTLKQLKNQVGLVITDSQVFGSVAKIVPKEIPLTSFSILFARYKGELEPLVSGVQALKTLKDGDQVLISEGCTHHRQCNDIGSVKIPQWIENYTGKKLKFVFTSGGEFPNDFHEIAMIVHCGGCMLNEREMRYRIACAQDAKVPITNYGILISYVKGILERSIRPLPEYEHLLF